MMAAVTENGPAPYFNDLESDYYEDISIVGG